MSDSDRPRPSGFLDTNLILRFILGDHDDQSPRARTFFLDLESNRETVVTSDTVVFETVFSLEGPKIGMPRSDIVKVMLEVLAVDAIQLPGKSIYRAVFGRYFAFPKLAFADCFHASQTELLTGGRMYSFDKGFDRLLGITRVEPA